MITRRASRAPPQRVRSTFHSRASFIIPTAVRENKKSTIRTTESDFMNQFYSWFWFIIRAYFLFNRLISVVLNHNFNSGIIWIRCSLSQILPIISHYRPKRDRLLCWCDALFPRFTSQSRAPIWDTMQSASVHPPSAMNYSTLALVERSLHQRSILVLG